MRCSHFRGVAGWPGIAACSAFFESPSERQRADVKERKGVEVNTVLNINHHEYAVKAIGGSYGSDDNDGSA